MSATIHLTALLCVAMIAAGQILFKATAMSLSGQGQTLSWKAISIGFTACAIYALATLLWIALLRHAPLNKLYPYMGLSFILVPAASWALFDDSITPATLLGSALIVAGVIIIGRFG